MWHGLATTYWDLQIRQWMQDQFESLEIEVHMDDSLVSIRTSSEDYQERKLDSVEIEKVIVSISNALESEEDLPSDMPLIQCLEWFWNERYLDEEVPPDKHDRVSFQAVKPNFRNMLSYPVFEILMSNLAHKLGVPRRQYREVIFSCDYDITNFWQQVGLKGSIRSLIKQFLKGPAKGSNALRSFMRSASDVSANGCLSLEMFPDLHSTSKVTMKNIAFLLIHQSHPQYDPLNRLTNPSFQTFIQQLKSRRVEIGLHPSYNSRYEDVPFWQKQFETVKELKGSAPESMRFHYLNADMPHDLDLAQSVGLKKDYSYAFADALCFRGGRSTPGKYVDTRTGRLIDIVSYPLTLMDTSLVVYNDIDFEVVQTHLDRAWNHGRSINLLFHNQYFDPFIDFEHADAVQDYYAKSRDYVQTLIISES